MNKSQEETRFVFSNHLATGIYVLADNKPCGPFTTKGEAQEYINDRDDHGYDVRDWEIVELYKL